MLIVEAGDPHHPKATALLRQSHALMQSLFPPEDNFYLEIDDLVDDTIAFFIARKGDDVIGTAALKNCGSYGEVKSMFVAEAARGLGAADALMRQLEDHARGLSLPVMKLETGTLLNAAHKLYARHGYATCGPFGDYAAGNSSVFMEKPL